MGVIGQLSIPTWIVIQLLERCNLRCNMCYEWGDNGAYLNRDKLAVLDFDKILSLVEECAPAKPKYEFFGGEPLLYPDIYSVIDAIRGSGSEVSFSTNGSLLEKAAPRLVETQPNLIWVSLDGPREINDKQRGSGVFDRVLRGLSAIHAEKVRVGNRYPEIGLTCVVTPDNYEHIDEIFLGSVDLSVISHVSIELQSYTTKQRAAEYKEILKIEFGQVAVSDIDGYIRSPDIFNNINVGLLVEKINSIKDFCEDMGVSFNSQPNVIAEENISNYLSANWDAMEDKKSRCAVPWISAEVSARGEVTTCHSFYDLPLGNIYESSMIDIWNGEKIKSLRAYLRKQLFPICTACCRYYD